MERESIGQREQSPPETYQYLNKYRGRIYDHPTKPIGCSIQEELFCKATGGSCMDLVIKHENNRMFTEWHAHITDKNEVAQLEGQLYNGHTNEYTIFQPDIADMISIVKDIRAQFDIDPYERPLF